MLRRPDPVARTTHATRRLALSLSLASLVGCQARSTEENTPSSARDAQDAQGVSALTATRADEEPFQRASLCRVAHGGMFLDLGTDASHARRSYALGPFSDVASDTWSDQSYTRFSSPDVQYDFWLTET